MGNQTAGTRLPYREQLLHPNWQRRRLERLEASGWACSACEDTGSTLHVHHRCYVKGRMVWEYDDDDLQVLCETCHAHHHADRALLDRVLRGIEFAPGSQRRTAETVAAALLAGFASEHLDTNTLDVGAGLATRSQHRALYALGKVAALLDCGAMQAAHIPLLVDLLQAVATDGGLPHAPAGVHDAVLAHWFGWDGIVDDL